MQRNYGGMRDVLDERDVIRRYGERPSDKKHDLIKYIHHVYDQGGLANCTTNAVCAAYGIELMRQAMESNNTFQYFDSSRLFLYYNSRLYTGTTGQNVGVSFRDTFKAMQEYGVCTEALWPYNERKFSRKPSSTCYQNALGNSILRYTRLEQHIDQFTACLKAGYPFTVGFEVYSSFDLDDDMTGLMSMPTEAEVQLETPTLHAVLAVGYDDNARCITILNSEGSSFGHNGYFYMPYEYILNSKRAHDFWKIEEVGERQQSSDM